MKRCHQPEDISAQKIGDRRSIQVDYQDTRVKINLEFGSGYESRHWKFEHEPNSCSHYPLTAIALSTEGTENGSREESRTQQRLHIEVAGIFSTSTQVPILRYTDHTRRVP